MVAKPFSSSGSRRVPRGEHEPEQRLDACRMEQIELRLVELGPVHLALV